MNLFYPDNEAEEESEDDEDYIPSEDWKKVYFVSKDCLFCKPLLLKVTQFDLCLNRK